MCDTPASKEKKRDASSPLDSDTVKKTRIKSTESTAEHVEQLSVSLSDEQLAKIAEILKVSFLGQLKEIATDIVDKAVSSLKQTFTDLESENKVLREKVFALEKRIETIERIDDKMNQYSRKNCLRLSGIPESEGESVENIAVKMFSEMGTDVALNDIDNIHRLAKKTTSNATPNRPRDIIIKFATFRARQKVYASRSALKSTQSFRKAFLNEELTKKRGEVFYHARKLAKDGRIKSAWTRNGIIVLKDNNDYIHKCECMTDLSRFQPSA